MNLGDSISRFVRFAGDFGIGTAFGYIIMPYLKKRKGLKHKHNAVIRYLHRWGRPYIDSKSLESETPLRNLTEPPIWVCWFQGEEQMPEVIRLCFASVRRMACGRQVILITKDNIGEYVRIPDTVESKRQKGELSLTHYADYLRILLLKEYGGLWIDASIYVTRPIDFKPSDGELYTVRLHSKSDAFVSGCRWTVGLLGVSPGSHLFNSLELLMRRYIEVHDRFIDFFLFDYLIALLYHSAGDIKNMIDAVPYNNEDFYKLEKLANQPFDDGVWLQLSGSQMFHRLSWKSDYAKSVDGSETFYGFLNRIEEK